MFPTLPLRPLRVVFFDTLRSLLPTHLLPPASPQGVPVYVMLPLDAALPSPVLPDLRSALTKLKQVGVTGIMVDVWWGLCEKSPNEYDFSPYLTIFELCKAIGLKIQATMSFHACGGNVGDSVNIPLPEWVIKECDERGLWFTDRHGWQNQEYISFGADHLPVLPGKSLRSPVQAYAEYVDAFVKTFKSFMKESIVELQIGLGPAGELRYPSYPMSKWDFPGIGEFQCFDGLLMEEMTKADCVPEGLGGYNDRPYDNEFFRKGYRTPKGKKFLDWYMQRMIKHGEDVLSAVKDLVDVHIAVKISGVHWWKLSKSRAAEATTGYIGGKGAGYKDIAMMLKKFDAIFDFTCLEMRTIDQPFISARSGPSQLVREVYNEARKAQVKIAGENALEVSEKGYKQVFKALRRRGAVGFTLLRLNEKLLQEDELELLTNFVKMMNRA